MKDLEQKQLDLISKPLPNEAVKPHPTKPYLSSIKAIYVTERFNEVFGVGKWTQKVELINLNESTGMVVVKAIFEVPEYGIYYECYGGNDNGGAGSKNFDLGDAFKGATTDALTKIGSYIGVGIDVFKGLKGNGNSDDLKWLNKGTPDWDSILRGVAQKKIQSLADARKYYKINNQTADELSAIIANS